jgi:curved DNA-binding protein CbpA
VHDYFDVLGVSPGARAEEILRACRRRVRRWHPDLPGIAPDMVDTVDHVDAGGCGDVNADVNIDFADMRAIVDRMRAAFFRRQLPL